MSNLAVTTADGDLYPVSGINSQSFYEYFAGNSTNKTDLEVNGICFVTHDGESKRPYRIFNRSKQDTPQFPFFRMMDKSNSLLTAWRSCNDHEPTEFDLINLEDMSHENIAWLRAAGNMSFLTTDKEEKLLALLYQDDTWRIDVRRRDNFQLREVVHHVSPVTGIFFHNDILFSLSDKLIASYPEERHENCLVSSCRKVIGWAKHPTEPYMILVEPDFFRIIDLDNMCVLKTAEWSDKVKWFNLLQKYSNHRIEMHTDKSIAEFSKDGNRLYIGGYGQLLVFNWHEMRRPRNMHPEHEKIISIQGIDKNDEDKSKILDAHIIDIVPVNRDKLICVTADGYLCMVNTRTEEVMLLLKPSPGVRINSLQLCPNDKYLTMAGYYYGYEEAGCCRVDSAMLVWKLSRLLNSGTVIK